MEEKVLKRWPTRTSYSALSLFEECPKAYMLGYYEGIDTPSGPAAELGSRLHKACERYLKGEIDLQLLPLQLVPIKPMLLDFKGKSAISEEVWLVTKNWDYQEEETPETAFKAIIDIHYVWQDWLYIWDLKTGRRWDSHYDQLYSYTPMGMVKYPDVKGVVAAPLYLDGPGSAKTFPREMLKAIQDQWSERWGKLFQNQDWGKNEGPESCRWCEYPRMGLCDSQ